MSPRPARASASFLRRLFRPRFSELAPLVLGDGAASLSRRQARDWALVLAARSLPHRLRRVGEGWSVQVPAHAAERAVQEVRLYLAENRPAAMPPLENLRERGSSWPTLVFMTLLLGFHALVHRPVFGLIPREWVGLGSCDAARVLAGEWWRSLTALSLHGDAAHALGNAVIGGTFLVLVCRRLGSGTGWVLALAAGALGNLCNALIQGPAHDSLGFSTAVFGAAAILAASKAVRGEGRSLRAALGPVTAGLGLLAMLGTGGENTDLGAHFLGFGAGLLLGAAAGRLAERGLLPGRRAEAALLALAFAALPAAWGLAFLLNG